MEQVISDLIFTLWDELIQMQSATHYFILAMFTVTWIWLGVNTRLILSTKE